MRTPDVFDREQDDDEPRETECKRCGKGGLHWEHDGDAWVLMESKYKIHHCNQQASIDEFDNLDEVNK